MTEPDLGMIPIEVYAETLAEAKKHFTLVETLEKILPDEHATARWTQPEKQLVTVIRRAVEEGKVLKAAKSSDQKAHIKATRRALQETVREAIPADFITRNWGLQARSFVQELKKISEV
jgi:hypothetical protein